MDMEGRAAASESRRVSGGGQRRPEGATSRCQEDQESPRHRGGLPEP